MIKSVEEIVIYESPDGGKTVYSRKSGSANRELVYQDPVVLPLARWHNWREIIYAAEDNVTLNDLIVKVEETYALIKEYP